MHNHDLLLVQSLDTEVEQLMHKHRSLSERDQLARAQTELQRFTAQLDEKQLTHRELSSRQKRYEDEAQIVAARIKRNEERLYSGEVKGVRDLQALQEEIWALRSRQSDFEDEALVAMEELETLGSDLQKFRSEADLFETRIQKLAAAIAAVEAEIDARLETIRTKRAEVCASLDTALLTEYDHLRPLFGTATVVRFDAGKCVGCPSMMPAMEVDRLKRSTDSVSSCDECGRIVLL